LSHFDSLDYVPSIVLWVMDADASTLCDQYLVFNNIVQTIGNTEVKKGVMIKTCDGMVMSFQGSTLHHATTIRRHSKTGELCPPGDVYGIHFGLSMPTLTAMRRIRIEQYIRDMCVIPKFVECKPSHDHRCYHILRSMWNKKKNQIKFQHQKQVPMDQVALQIWNHISHDNEYETTQQMEYDYYMQVSLEFEKKLFICIGNKEMRYRIKKMMRKLIYEQIVPNWTTLFMLIRNHQCIFDKY